MSMSKTAAIRASAGYVSISGRGTNWTVYGPHRVTDLRGPSTEITADSYTKARISATAWRAQIVMALMERLTDDARHAIEATAYGAYPWAKTDLHSLVDAALEAAADA